MAFDTKTHFDEQLTKLRELNQSPGEMLLIQTATLMTLMAQNAVIISAMEQAGRANQIAAGQQAWSGK